MPASEPGARVKISAPPEGDDGWQEVWRLVLEAEHRPIAERRSFVLAAQADSFVVRQALAIVEGSASIASYASVSLSMPSPGDEPFAPQVGMKIGRYRIGTLLGSGGGGSVYAGLDEELNRAVAIKFLSPQRGGKQGLAALSLREARAASALNHPNIITIHEVIETPVTAAIVMELVPGVTLRALAGKAPRLNDVLHWSEQLANALAVAHAHDLIHGDIKPENVMVREDGYVKMLDFGLALGALPDRRAPTSLIGTPRYLSPEQCLGHPPTPASDIFAFGVMLYELTTGQHPFKADGMLFLFQSIVSTDPPPPASLNPKLPRALDRLIVEMLAKRPDKRPTTKQTAERLAAIRLRLAAPHALFGIKTWWSSAAFAVAVATLLYVYVQPRDRTDLSSMSVRPMASQPGLEDNPSISPDGLWVSCLYRVQASDRPKLQVHSLQGGPPVEIETGGLVVQGPAAWSPDSTELAFSALEGSHEHSIYRVRRTGGVPHRIAWCRSQTNDPCELDWSPDGTTLAVADSWQDNSELYLVDLADGGRRELITPVKESVTRPRFSPDGKWIAYLKQVSSAMSYSRYVRATGSRLTFDDLYVVAVAGGQPRRITRNPSVQRGFVWSTDGKRLMAIMARLSHKLQMWQFPLDGGEPYSAGELDLTRGTQPTLSRGKGSLAWVRDLSANSIWRMPVDQSRQGPKPLTNSAAVDTDPEWSSSGRMVFRSDRSGASEVWIARADGSRPWQATRFRGPFVGDPHWSPDGRAIAFTSHADGNPDIYLMRCEQDAAACSEPRQLTRTPATDTNPTWSADGRWIYFSSSRSGDYEVWRMPPDGNAEPERLTWNGGYMARESADGKWLYYSKLVFPTTAFWRMALPARGPGQPETMVAPNVPGRAAATWALSARELFYYPSIEDPEAPFPPVLAVDVGTGRTRDLPLGNIRLARGLSLSPDGRWLMRSQIDRALTLVMIAE